MESAATFMTLQFGESCLVCCPVLCCCDTIKGLGDWPTQGRCSFAARPLAPLRFMVRAVHLQLRRISGMTRQAAEMHWP